jgi:hypothetical protein
MFGGFDPRHRRPKIHPGSFVFIEAEFGNCDIS